MAESVWRVAFHQGGALWGRGGSGYEDGPDPELGKGTVQSGGVNSLGWELMGVSWKARAWESESGC